MSDRLNAFEFLPGSMQPSRPIHDSFCARDDLFDFNLVTRAITAPLLPRRGAQPLAAMHQRRTAPGSKWCRLQTIGAVHCGSSAFTDLSLGRGGS